MPGLLVDFRGAFEDLLDLGVLKRLGIEGYLTSKVVLKGLKGYSKSLPRSLGTFELKTLTLRE